MKLQPNLILRAAALTAAASAILTHQASAVDYTWGGGTLDWTDTSAAGWTGGPPGGGDNATINSGTVRLTTNNQVNNLASVAIGGTGKLTQRSDIDTWSDFTNLTLGGGTLEATRDNGLVWGAYQLSNTVTVNGSSPSTISTNGSGNIFINLGLAVNDSETTTTFNVADVTTSPAADLTVSTVLGNNIANNFTSSSAAGLTKNGPGTMALTAANTYTGGTAINDGTLRFASGSLDSTAYVGLVGGTLQWETGNTQGLNKIHIYNGTTGTLDTNSNDVTLDAIQDNAFNHTGSLVKAGAGTLTFTGSNIYTGTTTVAAGVLAVNGSISSDVTVSDGATLAGGGTVGALSFDGGSLFDIFLAIGSANALDSTTISFSSSGFGIDNLVSNGAPVDWSTVANGTYTLINGTLDETNLVNFTSANAYDLGGGRSAYFEEGSLRLTVVPEPTAAALGLLGLGGLILRRRRA